MKKIWIIISIIIGFQSLSAASLTGTVLNSENQEPLENVSLELWSSSWNGGDSSTYFFMEYSDESGNYTFAGIESGTYTLMVYVIDGFEFQFLPDLVIEGDENLDVLLDPIAGSGFISGVVYNMVSSEPVENVQIALIPAEESAAWNFTYTLTDGSYNLQTPAGSYYVSCMQFARENPGSDSLALFQYFELWDDVQTFEEATIVDVAEGENVAGIDFGIPPPTTSSSPIHFDDILNGYLADYLYFHGETGAGIIDYIVIEAIETGDIGDEIGIIDMEGIPGLENCAGEDQDQVLVGAGVWDGNALTIPVYGSVDDCEDSGMVYPGFLEAHPITVVLWDASEDQESVINAEFSFGSPTPDVGGLPSPAVFGNQFSFATLGAAVNLEETTLAVDEQFAIYPNFPNPFNPSTRISYSLPEAADVSISIFDLKGRELLNLVRQHQPAGQHSVVWTGQTHTGDQVNAGLYFCRIQAGNHSRSIKITHTP